MAYGRAYGRRLFLYALIKGLGDAVRHDDEWAVDRYRRRLRSVAADFDTNPQIHESVEGLLWASGQWLTTNVVERGAIKEQILELTKRVMELSLPSAAS
jgi:hypothetical protein